MATSDATQFPVSLFSKLKRIIVFIKRKTDGNVCLHKTDTLKVHIGAESGKGKKKKAQMLIMH